MITRALIFILLACACHAQWTRLMPSALGDARLAGSLSTNVPGLTLVASLDVPDPEQSDVTFSGWYRFNSDASCATNLILFPLITYTPGPVQKINPDLLDDAGGHSATGIVVNGATVFTNFPFSGYALQAITNQWPRGVYTIDGESEQAITVSLGGNEVNLGPGAWNRNVIAGPDSAVTVSGAGLVRIGISKTPCKEFFQVSAMSTATGFDIVDSMLYAQTRMTNSVFNFWSIRLHLDASNHYFRAMTIGDGGGISAYTATNTLPVAGERTFTHSGIYQLLMVGIFNATNKMDTYFDVRSNRGWLTDDELLRIRDNGLQEINRRGL